MLATALSEFRATRTRSCCLVAGLNADEMSDRPSPEKWSVGELLEHLLLAEKLWRSEVEALIALKRSHRQPFLSRLLTDFPIPLVGRVPPTLLGFLVIPLTAINTFVPLGVFLTFLSWRSLSAKAPRALEPSRHRDPIDLRAALESEAALTLSLFADNRDLRFRRLLYQHPLLGIVDAVDLLRVITAHEKRHQEQLLKILESLGVRSRS